MAKTGLKVALHSFRQLPLCSSCKIMIQPLRRPSSFSLFHCWAAEAAGRGCVACAALLDAEVPSCQIFQRLKRKVGLLRQPAPSPLAASINTNYDTDVMWRLSQPAQRALGLHKMLSAAWQGFFSAGVLTLFPSTCACITGVNGHEAKQHSCLQNCQAHRLQLTGASMTFDKVASKVQLRQPL